jgi:hypothetical protein
LPKDRDRRDSLGWSILHGSLTSFTISNKMSRWVIPTKYFVSFPYGIYDFSILEGHRESIRGPKSFYLTHDDKTVREGKFLAFTFFPEDWPKFKWNIKNQCTGGSRSLPIQERWSSKNFTLDKIFNIDTIEIQKKVSIEKYYSLKSWESLREYYRSNCVIPRPSKMFMKPYNFNKEQS